MDVTSPLAHSEHAQDAPRIIPGLDGLRAISILLVMTSHSALAHVVPGVFGVTVFFFVSGFLITSLLLDEHAKGGGIAIKSFYIRRLLRLYPPLVVSILVTALVYWVFGTPVNVWGAAGALAYLANYLAIFRPDLMANLGGQLWSLAVEEHFYFFYPLLLVWLLPDRARLLRAILLLCLFALGVRIVVVQAFPDIALDYTGKATEARIDSILYGAVAAVLWWSATSRAWLLRHRRWLIGLGLALLLASFLWRNPVMRETVRYSLQGLGLIPLVLAVTVAGWLPRATRFLESAVLRWIGRHSYSLYLWHLLAFEIAEHFLKPFGPWPIYSAGWVLALMLAALSYRWVEAPFFALRKRFGSHVAEIDAARVARGG